jgi:hypothetical protein
MATARARPSSGGNGGIGDKTPLRLMNHRLRTFRGQAASARGDVSDVGQLYLTDVQAALAETSQTAFDPATQRPSIIRAIQCIVPGWADIETTDTIQDPATGFFYLIENIENEPGFGYRQPRKILTLRLRSGVSVTGER